MYVDGEGVVFLVWFYTLALGDVAFKETTSFECVDIEDTTVVLAKNI